ncbi:hypothetical protein HNW13_017725 [Shewanella sp. BF02_Schw]|uniref:hypothetical protein n=1 Tax=Shewanella sp. BF02_Schw TaxID=394908 RepID=UPI00177C84D6|nr:hypothetical protein [Shewanella sp. BF02_Schw]MBO1897579.1 hypothetical protein [Shewanella sp. BF02_Schw]
MNYEQRMISSVLDMSSKLEFYSEDKVAQLVHDLNVLGLLRVIDGAINKSDHETLDVLHHSGWVISASHIGKSISQILQTEQANTIHDIDDPRYQTFKYLLETADSNVISSLESCHIKGILSYGRVDLLDELIQHGLFESNDISDIYPTVADELIKIFIKKSSNDYLGIALDKYPKEAYSARRVTLNAACDGDSDTLNVVLEKLDMRDPQIINKAVSLSAQYKPESIQLLLSRTTPVLIANSIRKREIECPLMLVLDCIDDENRCIATASKLIDFGLKIQDAKIWPNLPDHSIEFIESIKLNEIINQFIDSECQVHNGAQLDEPMNLSQNSL